jgi:hypothetical protein
MMTRTTLVLALLLLPAAALAADPVPAEARLAKLSWLAGWWSGETDQGEKVEAVYTSPDGGAVLSITKAFGPDGACVFTEFERITVEKGEVVLLPFPDGQKACPFALTKSEGQTATFEAPRNDFPKKIVFALAGEALTITLEGEQGGQPARMSLKLTRSDAPGARPRG